MREARSSSVRAIEPAPQSLERRVEEELDYAHNQVRLLREQIAAAPTIHPHEPPAAAPNERLHNFLDIVQAATPEFLRAMVRRPYLKYVYHRLYPPQPRPQSLVHPEPVPTNLAHSGYPPLLTFKQRMCRNLSMGFESVETDCEPGLVSIVLPVYNGARYISQAIESVLRQTYQNFELIIVNDGSSDATARIVGRYTTHPRVRYFQQQHRKLPAALNAGFRRARGEYFTWVSDDNILHPEMLARLAGFLDDRSDVEMVYADEQLIDERGRPACGSDFCRIYQTPDASNVLRRPYDPGELNFIQNNYIGACFMYRAWAACAIGDYDRDCFGFEDYDYWMRMNALFRITHLGTGSLLHSYRLHRHSLTARDKELRIAERARYFLPIEAERRAFFEDGFDIDFAGEHPWFEELASIYRRSGHNARLLGSGANARYVEQVTRAFDKHIVLASHAAPDVFALFADDSVTGPDFTFSAQSPAALAWPLLAAANSRLWNQDRRPYTLE